MTTNRPEFQAHDDFIFGHKTIGKVTREVFIKYIRSTHDQIRKLIQIIQQYSQTIELFEENEQGRELAESVRVANEEERISKDSVRDSKIEVVEERIGENEEDLEQHKLDYADEISKKANKQQEEWITPTLINGWVEGNAGTRYFKDEFGIVHIDISLTNGSGNMFTLPSGYRPINTVEFWCNSGGNLGSIRVLANGNVIRLLGSGTYVISSGITFKAEG